MEISSLKIELEMREGYEVRLTPCYCVFIVSIGCKFVNFYYI